MEGVDYGAEFFRLGVFGGVVGGVVRGELVLFLINPPEGNGVLVEKIILGI